ncbi:folate-binding protein [Williamsia sp. CHRR-6]|uniref:CAF17-like 4Fe-4S cluster assembly/insertion protein YgfZ n=1 Tax=Williamsia sp. CHRR-6 TaxID=2835871 RepID=UPI0027DE50EF|nr:folate-binding protein [Williamsia sp. CHRR-6]
MTASPSTVLLAHRGSGAVPAPDDSPDAGVAWHFGDPLGEQRAALDGVIVVDRSHRGVIEISGEERLSWLHTISSQHVATLPDRRSAEDLSLDGNGRVEDHFIVTDIDGVTYLDTEHQRAQPLLDFLSRMVFWAKATPVARPDLAVLTLVGPGAVSGPLAALLEIPEHAQVYQAGSLPEQHHDDEPQGFWRVMPPLGEADAPLPRVDVMVPTGHLTDWWTLLTQTGARPAGIWAFEALRAVAVMPRLGVDTDEKTIPHEVAWIGDPDHHGAVHLDKGCYRGQETVARVHNLGQPPRRLVLLQLDGSADARPVTGDPITAGGRSVGRVGTVVDHHEYGPVAVALVKRTIPVDTPLLAGGVDARIDPASVPTDDRVPAGRAAIEKLRGR